MSNRLEILAESLAEVLKKPLSSPFHRETIVVQSRGMDRWLSMQLANHHGICANYNFLFPNRFAHEAFRCAIPDLPDKSPFDPQVMTWRIMSHLPALTRMPQFISLSNYLEDAADDLRLIQLSEQISDTFDQYLLFRPEMIFQWEHGHEDDWQALLWREIVKGHEGEHRAALAKRFFKAVKSSPTGLEGLPERICLFGISALPRFFLQVLGGISAIIPVNLFLMNPCMEYWGDILSDWEIKRTGDPRTVKRCDLDKLHLEKGNNLLASMGKLGRDFFDMINDLACEEILAFEEPGDENLLSSIQSDILNLRNRGKDSGGKKVVSKWDSSIKIHSCHSPLREVEVLYDQLLDMFEKDSALKPKDILIMTPDIEIYAPYIHAVFDSPEKNAMRIPYSVADRNIRNESDVVEPFLGILDLAGSRFSASQVFSILESKPVHRKFDLHETELECIRGWVSGTRIRWGIDETYRGSMDLPTFRQNTWRAGLDRLLLGYAIPGRNETLFEGILPFDDVEGNEAQVLGKLMAFIEKLFDQVPSLTEPKTLGQWAESMTLLLDDFFSPEEGMEREIQSMRDIFNDWREMGGGVTPAFSGKVSLKAIRWHLGRSLEKKAFGFGYITGGATFCAMLPMRSIPFKIIYLMGMNSDAYPRDSKSLSFDRIAEHPKAGDRSRRHDDRYLFLEALLSAREKLHISYVGQSMKDNSTIPPSVLVSELMDYLEQGFDIPGNPIQEHIIIKHRLQAFSPEYFRGQGRLFSYSETNCRSAKCLLGDREDPIPYITEGLCVPEDTYHNIEIEDLWRFFANPSKFILKERLGIQFDKRASVLEDKENFDIKGLDRYQLGNDMLERKLGGRSLKEFLNVAQAAGKLPHGKFGECLYQTIRHGVERFAENIADYTRVMAPEPIKVALKLGDHRILGEIRQVRSGPFFNYRYARIKARDRLKVWIKHLILNCLQLDAPEGTTSLLAGTAPGPGKDPVCVFYEYQPVTDSALVLSSLLKIYRRGLSKPLHFFPEASLAYTEDLLAKGKSDRTALKRAENAWSGTDYKRGEGEDPYYQLCFRNTDPFDLDFCQLAQDIFSPLLEHERYLGNIIG